MDRRRIKSKSYGGSVLSCEYNYNVPVDWVCMCYQLYGGGIEIQSPWDYFAFGAWDWSACFQSFAPDGMGDGSDIIIQYFAFWIGEHFMEAYMVSASGYYVDCTVNMDLAGTKSKSNINY